jgi:curved DNA-binding protein
MKYEDYYKILQVARDASQDDIKRSYRRLARKYHPDVSKEADAEDKFKSLGEAYEVLKDPEKRAAYDQLGSNWKAGQDFTPPPGWENSFSSGRGGARSGGTVDFSDLFEGLFGGGQRGRGAGGRAPRRGADSQVKVQISLEDAFVGIERLVRLQSQSGLRRLNVKIPAGVVDGQQIRLAGQGQPSRSGGGAGDLFLVIELLPHAMFRCEGKDIHLELPIAPWEAALGATVTVPTLDGSIGLKIPMDSQAGRKLRIKGRGLGDGDFYAQLQIVVPPASNESVTKLYEQMRDASDFDPRAKLHD